MTSRIFEISLIRLENNENEGIFYFSIKSVYFIKYRKYIVNW